MSVALSSSDSDNSTTFEYTDDINALIESSNTIYNTIHSIDNKLTDIHTQILAPKPFITINYNNWTGDLSTFIHDAHITAMEHIDKTGENIFGDILLEMIDCAIFHYNK